MLTIRTIEAAIVVSTREVAERTFITDFRSPEIAPLVRPGQFVMVSFPNSTDPLLARAFSVSDVRGKNISLLYTAVGKGTSRLSRLKKGASVLINGPLGNGFPGFVKHEKVWAVLGGSGAALIPILSKYAKRGQASIKIFYGARTKRQLVNFGDVKPYYSTDDGTKGYHGTILDLVKKQLKKQHPDRIFACGPTGMLVALQRSLDASVPLYVSVETPMACGMGFCPGCPVKMRNEPGYFLACKDGPVFDSKEVELE